MSFVWMQDRYRSIELWFDNPNLSSVDIDDHIKRLNQVYRWSGAVRRNSSKNRVSVLEHAVTVCAITEQLLYKHYQDSSWRISEIAWEALHHDDEEAFPPYDIPSPLKKLILTKEGLEYTERLRYAIWRDIYGRVLSGPLDNKQQSIIDLADKMSAFMEGIALWPHELNTVNGIDYSIKGRVVSEVFGFDKDALGKVANLSPSYRGLYLPIIGDFQALIQRPKKHTVYLKTLNLSTEVWESAFKELDSYLKRGEHEART